MKTNNLMKNKTRGFMLTLTIASLGIAAWVIFNPKNSQPYEKTERTDHPLRKASASISKINKLLSKARVNINFYGRITDENNNPVKNAEILYTIVDASILNIGGIMKEGRDYYETKSDNNGHFKIEKIGYRLSIDEIRKNGYIPSKGNVKDYIYYGTPDIPKISVENPQQFMVISKQSPLAISLLETEIDTMEDSLPQMTHFVLPGGHTTVSYCHVARCVCRRAERLSVHLSHLEHIDEMAVKYLNRLSDYLFVLARKLSFDLKAEEVKWIPRK